MGGDPLLDLFDIDVMKWSDRYLLGRDANVCGDTDGCQGRSYLSDTLYSLGLSRAVV